MSHSFESENRPTIFLIRHGEKPAPTPDDPNPVGLSKAGNTRADALPSVFGKNSEYNIQYIMAQNWNDDPSSKKYGQHDRPYFTVLPLAESLSLKVHKSHAEDDTIGAARSAKAYPGPGNVLICWEHKHLAPLAHHLGVQEYAPSTGWTNEKGENRPTYPGKYFDIIWCVPWPYTEIKYVRSEQVEGLDQKDWVDASGNALPLEEREKEDAAEARKDSVAPLHKVPSIEITKC